jgi:tyrosyl-tRNA synthetase
MTLDERYNLITRDLQEVIRGEALKKILNERDPTVYWGTAPTGSPSVGYIIPALKLRDIVNAGCNLIILIADIHAFLDNLKTPFEKIKQRTQFYILLLKSLLNTLGVDLSKVKFVIGSDYQLNPEVTMELFKLCSITSTSQAIKAGTEVVKQAKDPNVTSLIYPMLQALDEHFLNVDATIGGIDQKKIYGYSIDNMSKIGFDEKITYLMNPMVPGLSIKPSNTETNKMSSSDPNTKIDLLDTAEVIKKKISKAYCLEKDINDNSVLSLFKNLVFKIKSEFDLKREEKYGGNKHYASYIELELDYANGNIGPADLKNNLALFLIAFLEPIRRDFSQEENKKVFDDAYK